MSTDVLDTKAPSTTGIRVGLAVFGILSIVVGIIFLRNQAAVATTLSLFLVALIGIYTVIAGIAVTVGAFFTEGLSFWGRALRLIVGVIAVIAGVVYLVNPVTSAAFTVIFAVVMIGVLWVIEGVVTFFELGSAPSKGWAIFYAIVSILAGIAVIISPFTGLKIMIMVMGISAIVWGLVAFIGSIRLPKHI